MNAMLSRLYDWYGKTIVRVIFLVVIVLIVIAAVLSLSRGETTSETTIDSRRAVDTALVAALSSEASLELIGSVEAIDQARIESEAAGRVTSVLVSLGDTIEAGQVIGQLENASERAVVLQAEGVYEAALATAAQRDSSAVTAETSLKNAQSSGLSVYRSAFTSADNVVRNTVDLLFSDPTGNVPGFRLDGLGRATELTETRKSVETVLTRWSENALLTHNQNDAVVLLAEAETDLEMIARFVETVALTAADSENDSRSVNGTSIATIRTNMSTARATMNSTRQSVENAATAVRNAEDALLRAQIGGTNTDVSSANAQVKQALGSLRTAQANLEKTIFRSPISGTINTLSIKVGDFVNTFTEVAQVANNNAFEITIYIGENDRNKIASGDRVMLEGGQEGAITSIAPAVDQNTKKIEVRIATENEFFSSGDTVRATIPLEDTDRIEEIIVPITALKVETDRIVIFTVDADGVLIAHPVLEGPLVGDSIIIIEGITPDMTIVTDARGLNEGDKVLAE